MPSYHLSKEIEVKKQSTSYTDGETPNNADYEHLKYSYANVSLKSGGAQYGEYGVITETSVQVIVRYDADIDYECQFIINDYKYAIEHIWVPGRNDWMIIECVKWED